MASDSWTVYDQFMLEKSNGTQDLDSDTFKIALFTSSHTPNSASHTTYSGLTNEVATAYGYTSGGSTLTTTLTKTAGNIEFSVSANPTWTASGGSIVCAYAVIYNSTTGGLVAYSMLNNVASPTATNVTATDGNTLTIDITTNAIYNETRS